MKKLRCFLMSFFVITLICANLNAMEQEDNEKTVLFNCLDSDELVEVPVKIIKHSLALNYRFEMNPFEPFYPLHISLPTLYAIVDCLYIIDAQIDVENKLIEYIAAFVANHTQEEMGDFYFAGPHLRIQSLCDSFTAYIKRIKKKISYESVQKIDEVIQQAHIVFEKVLDKENSAIIIDVDNTALSCKKALHTIEIDGKSTGSPYFPALPQVYAFYTKMVEKAFKIFFLTSRTESIGCEVTAHNLIGEGYHTFEKIIFVPRETRLQIREQANGDTAMEVSLFAQWKESERNKIAETFTIVGTLDDVEENLQGENVGYPVLIPRFF